MKVFRLLLLVVMLGNLELVSADFTAGSDAFRWSEDDVFFFITPYFHPFANMDWIKKYDKKIKVTSKKIRNSSTVLTMEIVVENRKPLFSKITSLESGYISQSFISFDTLGNITGGIGYRTQITGTDTTTDSTKTAYVYDSQHNCTEIIHSNWLMATQDWKSSDRYVYKYDTDNKLTEEVHYRYSTADSHTIWIPYSKDLYTYSVNGNDSAHISYDWDETVDNFVPAQKEIVIFTEKSEPESSTVSILKYEFDNGKWSPYGKSFYYADKHLVLDSVWNDTLAALVPKYKKITLYDSSNNFIQKNEYFWNDSISNWRNTVKYSAKYDENTDLRAITSDVWSVNDSSWNIKILDSLTWEFMNNTGIKNGTDEFLTSKKCAVYSFRTKKNILILHSKNLKGNLKIDIFNTLGKKLIERNFKITDTSKRCLDINISTLSRGVYYYVLRNDHSLLKVGRVSITE